MDRHGTGPRWYWSLCAFEEYLITQQNIKSVVLAELSISITHIVFRYEVYTVIMTEAFLYQLKSGFSPFLVCVSST
jgi:hypothetical protein